jgi:hypothetical protein
MFENPTASLVCEDRVLLVRVFFFAGSSIKNSSEQFVSCIHLSFYKFRSASNPTNKNQTELGLEIQTVLSR